MYSELNTYFWTKISLTCIVVLISIASLPRLNKHRQHPVLKYRTMPVYVMTIIAASLLNIIDLIKSDIHDITVSCYRALCICYALSCSMIYGGIFCIGIRFYSLVFTRYIQGQLMEIRTCYDGVFYRRVVSEIRWARYMTFEKTAIKISAILFVFYLASFTTLFSHYSHNFTHVGKIYDSSYLAYVLDLAFVTISILFFGMFFQIILKSTAFYDMLLTIKFSVTHAALGVVLAIVYPGERPDNFFVYEQLLVSICWICLNSVLFLQPEIYGGQTKQIFIVTQHISQSLLTIFELTLPLYIINIYGYPEVDTEKKSPSDRNISPDRPNQSETTSDSVIHTMRSPLGIDEIMGDRHFRELFCNYLGREFQFEAFLFFDAIQYHKDVFEENANSIHFLTKEDAQRIIDEFIVEDAVNKLPISDRICKQILDDFSKLDDENPENVASIFEPAIDNLKTRLSLVVYKFNNNV